MTDLSRLLIGAAFIVAAVVILLTRWREKRLLDRLTAMVSAAMEGEFTEDSFDESKLSALETRLARYLAAGTTSARSVSAERDRIRGLIADISHQTKTPISNILLYSQILGEKDLPEDCQPAVDALQGQAGKLNFLIGSLVKLSRLETGVITVTPRPAQVGELMEAVAAQIAPKASAKGVVLTMEPAPETLTAAFDPKWTAEALYNLVDNAVKYTPPDGSVRLSATGFELFCRIDVTDTGIGIPEAEQSKVFARFYRSPTVTDQEGVGIGLFLARQIAASEGGYLKVRSKLGVGSTFSMFLPRDEAKENR